MRTPAMSIRLLFSTLLPLTYALSTGTCAQVAIGSPEKFPLPAWAFPWAPDFKPPALVPGPQRFLNAHFLNPAYLIPLVEVSPHPGTDKAVTGRLMQVLTAMGKEPVLCAATPGQFSLEGLDFHMKIAGLIQYADRRHDSEALIAYLAKGFAHICDALINGLRQLFEMRLLPILAGHAIGASGYSDINMCHLALCARIFSQNGANGLAHLIKTPLHILIGMAHRPCASQSAIKLDCQTRAIILHNGQFFFQIDALGIGSGPACARGLELIEGGEIGRAHV